MNLFDDTSASVELLSLRVATMTDNLYRLDAETTANFAAERNRANALTRQVGRLEEGTASQLEEARSSRRELQAQLDQIQATQALIAAALKVELPPALRPKHAR